MNIDISIDNDTLSENELQKLVQCIREIKQNRPEFPYVKVIEFDKKSK
jgi:hypothetical protein